MQRQSMTIPDGRLLPIMARRRRNRELDKAEALAKLIVLGLVLVAFSIGGITGFTKTFSALVGVILIVVLVAAVALVGFAIYRHIKKRPEPAIVIGAPDRQSATGVESELQ